MSSFPCRTEFDCLTDLLRQRTIESDLPTSMVSHKKNGGSIRTNEPGGSTSHRMAADYSAHVKVRTSNLLIRAFYTTHKCRMTDNYVLSQYLRASFYVVSNYQI
jgi:hypothetical protein